MPQFKLRVLLLLLHVIPSILPNGNKFRFSSNCVEIITYVGMKFIVKSFEDPIISLHLLVGATDYFNRRVQR